MSKPADTRATPQSKIKDPGFWILQSVLSESDCDHLLATLGQPSLKRSRAGARHLMREPAVAHVARAPRLLELARDALGSTAVPYRATLFEKSGLKNWLVVWHQDTALPLETKFDAPGWGPWSEKCGIIYAHAPSWALSRIVALRIHLDASTMDNGPLKLVPGTHVRGVLNDDEISAEVSSSAITECLVARGGVLAMRPLLVHASSKAKNVQPRRVLHIEYADSLELAPGIRLALA